MRRPVAFCISRPFRVGILIVIASSRLLHASNAPTLSKSPKHPTERERPEAPTNSATPRRHEATLSYRRPVRRGRLPTRALQAPLSTLVPREVARIFADAPDVPREEAPGGRDKLARRLTAFAAVDRPVSVRVAGRPAERGRDPGILPIALDKHRISLLDHLRAVARTRRKPQPNWPASRRIRGMVVPSRSDAPSGRAFSERTCSRGTEHAPRRDSTRRHTRPRSRSRRTRGARSRRGSCRPWRPSTLRPGHSRLLAHAPPRAQ